MKTKLLSFAIASFLALGTTAFAQAPADTAKTECKKGCTDKDRCHKKKGDRCDRKAPNPFEGITLTAQQQEALAAIPTPCQVMKAARDSKNAADSSAMKTPEMRREFVRNVRLNYLSQVKSVLTPEQYVQFLENSFANHKVTKDGKKGHKDGRKDGKKWHKHGKKGGNHASAKRR